MSSILIDAEMSASIPTSRNLFSSFLLFHSGRVNDENRWMETPERIGNGSKSARKMFGSIERGLDRVRLMLTPRRRQLQRFGGENYDSSSGGPNIVPNKVGLCTFFL